MHVLSRVAWETTHAGRRLRIVLRASAGNVVDRFLAQELADVLESRVDGPHLRAVTLEAEGPDFSVGTAVEEHLPGSDAGLLLRIHRSVVEMIELDLPVIAAVRGRCMGGGFDLVLGAHRLVASPDAAFGQPEVLHGMFAPSGSVLLPERVGRGLAEELLLTGRTLGAPEALAAGLVQQVAADPESAATAWFEEHLLPRSAMAIRFATRAARAVHRRRLRETLSDLERRFLGDLMTTRDAREGVASLREGREPRWVDA